MITFYHLAPFFSLDFMLLTNILMEIMIFNYYFDTLQGFSLSIIEGNIFQRCKFVNSVIKAIFI